MLAAALHEHSADAGPLRAAMAGPPSTFVPPPDLVDIRNAWRRLQVRQLFRLSLEALFYWTMLNLEGPPRSIDALVKDFLDQLPPWDVGNAGTWMSSLSTADEGPTELIAHIQQAFDDARFLPYRGTARRSASRTAGAPAARPCAQGNGGAREHGCP
jgi:hypothetical protein